MTPYQVTAKALGFGGDTVCEITAPADAAGKILFAPGLIPGEQAEVELLQGKERFARGTLLQITAEHAARVAPPCPYFTACGGCDYQHIQLTAQRELKRQMVADTLSRQHKIPLPAAGVILRASELPGYNYRSRVTVHLDRAGNLGFFKRQSSAVVPITTCLLCEEPINRALPALTAIASKICHEIHAISIEVPQDKVQLAFHLHDGVSALSAPSREAIRSLSFSSIILKDNRMLEQYASQPSADTATSAATAAFSQVNRAGNRVLQDIVVAEVSRHNPSALLEFYAGAGNFTFPLLAATQTHITAVELDQRLCAVAQATLEQQRLTSRCTFVQSSTEKFIKKNHRLLQATPWVLLDPPRTGALALAQVLDPARTIGIVYVSCNVATFGRDIRTLVERGYILTELSLVDMFSQTHHVELVATLRGK